MAIRVDVRTIWRNVMPHAPDTLTPRERHSDRRPRLGDRVAATGSHRRQCRPRLRRQGHCRRSRPPRDPRPGAGAGGRHTDLRMPRRGLPVPRGLGRGPGGHHRGLPTGVRRLGGIHEAARTGDAGAAYGRQHPPRAAAGLPRCARGARRPRLRRHRDRHDLPPRRRGRRHRADHRAARRGDRARRHGGQPPRTDQGRRAGDARRRRGPDGPAQVHRHRQEGRWSRSTTRPVWRSSSAAWPTLASSWSRPAGRPRSSPVSAFR